MQALVMLLKAARQKRSPRALRRCLRRTAVRHRPSLYPSCLDVRRERAKRHQTEDFEQRRQVGQHHRRPVVVLREAQLERPNGALCRWLPRLAARHRAALHARCRHAHPEAARLCQTERSAQDDSRQTAMLRSAVRHQAGLRACCLRAQPEAARLRQSGRSSPEHSGDAAKLRPGLRACCLHARPEMARRHQTERSSWQDARQAALPRPALAPALAPPRCSGRPHSPRN
mmetsp:Transcript_34735/g.88393  ORF Transcript_34735/g.88393 Transcript_34735/m.88393 type:complete len:229 (-) Transcript_34735:830-1516(-)